MTLVARQSQHIQEDIKRNWSSWNFGQDGIKATEQELQDGIASALESDGCIYISGFELYGKELESADIRELYPNYWVLVDNTNRLSGLSCLSLSSTNLENAKNEIKNLSFSGDGISFDAESSKLVASFGDIHIFEV